jgi:hypothetical protein
MGDENFLKYILCTKLHWNPYSEEVKKIPDIFWVMQYHTQDMLEFMEWDTKLEPQAELVGMISNPRNFSEYFKHKKSKDNKTEYVNRTEHGEVGYVESQGHLDPVKGIVDDKGNVIISMEMLKRSSSNIKELYVSVR